MDFLTRKLGPLPTWAWAALIVGGFVVYRLRQNASSSAAGTGSSIYGGELSPEYSPGYGGQFSLNPDSLLPVSAAPLTASMPDTSQAFGGGSPANAPSSNLVNGTGLTPRTAPLGGGGGGFITTPPSTSPALTGGPEGQQRIIL